jgi:transposase
MALNTFAMARCCGTPPSTRIPVRCSARPQSHTSVEFVTFLTDIVINQLRGKEIHVIADNQSAHKSGSVQEFLAMRPKVRLHFTSTYSSWLNQVERWFGKI